MCAGAGQMEQRGRAAPIPSASAARASFTPGPCTKQTSTAQHPPALEGCTIAFHSCRNVLGSTMVTSPCEQGEGKAGR